MPSAVLLSRFRRFYSDPSVWRGPHYRTRDQVIPFRLFWIYYRAMPSVQALERVQFARGVASAIGMAFGKAGSLPESLRRDLRDAFLDGG